MDTPWKPLGLPRWYCHLIMDGESISFLSVIVLYFDSFGLAIGFYFSKEIEFLSFINSVLSNE